MKRLLGIFLLVLISAIVTACGVCLGAAMFFFGLPLVAIVLFICVLFWAIIEDYNIWWTDSLTLIMLHGILGMGWGFLFIILVGQHIMP